MKLRQFTGVALTVSLLSSSVYASGITVARMEASQLQSAKTIVDLLRKSAQAETKEQMIQEFKTAASIYVDEPRAHQDSGRRSPRTLVHVAVQKKLTDIGIRSERAAARFYANAADTQALFDALGELKIDRTQPSCVPTDWLSVDPKNTVRESIHLERSRWFSVRIYFCGSISTARSASVYLDSFNRHIGRITFNDAAKVQKIFADIKHKSEAWNTPGSVSRQGL